MQLRNRFCISNIPKKNIAGIVETMYLCAYMLVSGSCFSFTRNYSEKINTIASGMNAIVVIILALLRYWPHRFRFPNPKAYETRVSSAPFIPIMMDRQSM